MHHRLSLLGFLALAVAPFTEAAKSTTRTSTMTVFLPPRATGSATNIYASLITKDSSKTEYLLACQTAFTSPYTCDGDYKGITVTYSASSEMDVALNATTYDCKLASSSAVCATKTASSASEQTTTLNSSQSKAWMTPITVLDVQKTTSKKSTKTTAAAAVCKRSSSSNSNSGSSGSSSGSSSSSSSSSSKNSKTTKKKNGDSCSGGAKMTWDMGVAGVVGAALAIVIAL